ncbi:SHNi-TPR-domain-containing protein [Lipomyces arxii]|uniref:SHNi-TPR-domain-containing protein n=1 Tax=Lipomyces arxii TaxID=56418 RepID=UPI0034CE8DF6
MTGFESSTDSKGQSKEVLSVELKSAEDIELEKVIAAGSQAYGLKNYEDATEQFAKACETYSMIHGQENPELLFLYGRALFQVAVSSSDVLGGTSESSSADKGGLIPKGLTPSSPRPESSNNQGLFQFTGDAVDDDSDKEDEQDGENQEEEAEEESDFETAWDVLDLARTLFVKQLEDLRENEVDKKRDLQLKLADIYDILGEISLESENFPQASNDLEMSLNLKEDLYPPESTFISEACFKLSLALELIPDPPEMRLKAADLVQKAIDSLTKRSEISGENDPTLLNDLQIRLQELRNTTKAPDVKNELANMLGSVSDDIKDKLVQTISQVTDISGLVKRKRPSSVSPVAGPSNSSREKTTGEEEDGADQRKKFKPKDDE